MGDVLLYVFGASCNTLQLASTVKCHCGSSNEPSAARSEKIRRSNT